MPATRAAMGPAAAAFHGHPSRDLDVVGVTGTNGKTTTTHLLRSVLEAAGRPAEVIGTLTGRAHDARGDRAAATARRRCATRACGRSRWRSRRTRSHSTAWTARGFASAVFTNLSRDHLDFHAVDGRLLRGQGVAVHARPLRPRRRSTSTTSGAACSSTASQVPWEPYSLADVTDVEVDVALVALPLGRRRAARAARRRVQPVQRAGRRRDRARARHRSRAIAAGLAAAGPGARTVRAGRRGTAVRRHRRLRPHAGRARAGAPRRS